MGKSAAVLVHATPGELRELDQLAAAFRAEVAADHRNRLQRLVLARDLMREGDLSIEGFIAAVDRALEDL